MECDEVENEKGSEISMKGFVIKTSMSEMVSLGKGRNERVGSKVFLARGCREKSFSD